MKDESNHVLIGIEDKGLSPISEYMLEKNFKQRVQDTHLGFLKRDALQIPFMEVVKVETRRSSSGVVLYDVLPILNTRQGDKIILGDGKSASRSDNELLENMNESKYVAKAKTIANSKKPYYQGIAMKANASTIIQPLIRTPLSIELKSINENEMFKYLNTNNNMWYIYDPVNLVAFSYYDDDYIPECYGMLDWIENLTEKTISMTSLYQRYTIIGL